MYYLLLLRVRCDHLPLWSSVPVLRLLRRADEDQLELPHLQERYLKHDSAIKNYEKVKDMSEEEGTKKEDVQKGREGEEGR